MVGCRPVNPIYLVGKLPASQVQLAKINESPFDVTNGSTLQGKSCLADGNTRVRAAMIASG